MYILGLTGGIGSGKTTVAKLFEKKGVPVYYADDQAKILMQTHKELTEKIKKLFGENAYTNDKLNTKYIGGIVFKNPDKLKQLEALVHPVVIKDFHKWVANQKADYVIMENAILHKSGMDHLVDDVILVQSDIEKRWRRVMERDAMDKKMVLDRIKNQDNFDKLLKKSKYIINNDFSLDFLAKKVNELDLKVKNMLNKS